jgi:hypothetical protein
VWIPLRKRHAINQSTLIGLDANVQRFALPSLRFAGMAIQLPSAAPRAMILSASLGRCARTHDAKVS